MDDLSRYWSALTAFADAHPLLTWIVVTSVLNALVRAWPRLQHTLPGRLFSLLCQGLGVDALGVLKVGAAGAGARALTMAAGGLGTSPEALKRSPASLPPPPSSPPAILDTTTTPPRARPPARPAAAPRRPPPASAATGGGRDRPPAAPPPRRAAAARHPPGRARGGLPRAAQPRALGDGRGPGAGARRPARPACGAASLPHDPRPRPLPGDRRRPRRRAGHPRAPARRLRGGGRLGRAPGLRGRAYRRGAPPAARAAAPGGPGGAAGPGQGPSGGPTLSLELDGALGASGGPSVVWQGREKVQPGRFFHVTLKMPIATATASQILRGTCAVEGFFE